MLDPPFFGRIADVHVLRAYRAAVGFAQPLDDFAQRETFGTEKKASGVEHHVHVGLGKIVESRLELRDVRPLLALQGIQVSPARAQEPVRADELLHEHLLARYGDIAGRHA